MKKIVSLLLCALMTIACFGCNNTPNTSGEESVPSSDASSGEPQNTVVNEWGWEVPTETIEFTVYTNEPAKSGDQQEEDAYMAEVAEFYKEHFNVVIHKSVYKQDVTERLNLMLSGNEYPDVLVDIPDEMAEVFISQDRAVELTPYLEEYGNNILEYYGNYINLLKNKDGRLYKLAFNWGSTTDNRGQDFSIRWDMMQEAGLPMFDSFESFYESVSKLVELYPTNASGEKTYGLTTFGLKGEEFYRAPLSLMGFRNAPTGFYKEDENGKITHWVDTEEGLEVAKYINRFWRDGLIDPDFQTKDYDTAVAFMSNDRVVANMGTWWHVYSGGHIVWRATEEDWTTDHRFQNVTFEPTEETPCLITDNFIRTTRCIITDTCDKPEDVIRYMNWEVTPVGVAFASMGIPGEDRCWHLDENGDVAISDKYWYGSYSADDPDFDWYAFKEQNGAMSYWLQAPGYSTMGKEPADGYASPTVAVNMWDFLPDFSQLDLEKLDGNKLIDMYCMETSKTYKWDQTLWTVQFTPDDPETLINQDIKEKLPAEWIKVFTADSEEECEAQFHIMREYLHTIGLDDLVAFQQKALDENRAAFNG